MSVMPDELARARKIESTVEKIKDVIACRAVFGKDGEVDEVHVLASERSPRYIARDIESAILVNCGETLDRRKISIAQLGQEGYQGQGQAGANESPTSSRTVE